MGSQTTLLSSTEQFSAVYISERSVPNTELTTWGNTHKPKEFISTLQAKSY